MFSKTKEQVMVEPDADFVVDFEKMGVVCIERVVDGTGAITVLGYILPSGGINIKEWFLSCNIETHNRLVTEFRAYLDENR